MFSKRSSQKELMDGLVLDEASLNKNLRELEITNSWFGGKNTLISALNMVHQKHANLFRNKKTTIADLGCGGGDLLIAIHDWAKCNELNVDLVGIDTNSFMIQYATEKSSAVSNIRFENVNVISDAFSAMQFDIVCLNNFCHHLRDPELISLLKQLKKKTNLAIFINDLHRHWLPYLAIVGLSRLLNFSYLAKHDGSLSVLRAFQKHELIHLLALADIDCYTIHWRWTFRWQIIIWQK